MSTKNQILDAALQLFTVQGFNATTVGNIRREAQVSNGSFFHAFASKDELGAQLYLRTLESYHSRLVSPLATNPAAGQGIELLINAHLCWVVEERPQARFLFDQAQSTSLESIRSQQNEANEQLQKALCKWLQPLTAAGALFAMPSNLFMAELIGPAQLICRAWLSGRSDSSPVEYAQPLVAAAQRALLVDHST